MLRAVGNYFKPAVTLVKPAAWQHVILAMQGTSLGIADHRPSPSSVEVFATQRARLCPTACLVFAHRLWSRTSTVSLPDNH